ncbi:nickel-dependent lactate racemase [Mucisphaera sp.]|uniref:nickel-dependent lactate racemase n=1 Tax=Mucisphaera sp. TaxID=2913024 RepID=UPI003D103148
MSGSGKEVALRYDRGRVSVHVPEHAEVLEAAGASAVADAEGAVLTALRSPIGCDALVSIARQKKPERVVVTISDITRPVPNEPILKGILAELAAAGVTEDRVTVLVATGMHRPSTEEERVIMLGADLASRLSVVDHVSSDPEQLVRISEDPPVGINKLYLEADLKIVTGLIEPHFMAGYSGGRKGICPGLVDLATISRFHGFQTMADPRSAEGVMDGNPCHDEALRVARIVGCDFLVNCAIDESRKLAGVYAGDLEAAHEVGCEQVAGWNSVEVTQAYDLVISNGGGYPLDESFYQTIKGIVMALPALHEGSRLVVASKCTEVGSAPFAELVHRYDGDWRGFLAAIEATDEIIKDQWSFHMQTRVLALIGQERLMLASDGLPVSEQQRWSVTPVSGEGSVADRLQAEIDRFVSDRPDGRIGVIPEGPYTMLRAAEPALA